MTISYKGNLRVKLLSLLLLFLGLNSTAIAQVTATFYCSSGTYKTGSVNSAGTKNDGNMTTINSSTNRGWATFDLSSIPTGSTVSAVTLKFTTYSTTLSSATNNVYGFLGDPVTMAGASLYSSCGSGTSLNASSWSANALQTKVLNATGVAFVAANVGGSINIGFVRGSTNTYNIYGYPGAPADQPQLVITYVPSVACSATPTAGTTTGPTAAVCPSAGFTLGLSGATAASGITYQWESSVVGAGVWTPIAGATASTYVSSTATAAADYHCVVTCSNTGDAAVSTTFTVTINPFYNCYCASSATSTADEEILNVTFGTLNNSSVCGVAAPGPGSTASMYSNYSTLTPTTVFTGSAVPLSVQIGTCGGNYGNWTKVFIDYNQDGAFTSAGEEVYSSATYTTGPHFETGTVLIPTTALIGVTRMRVVNVETTVASGVPACGTYTWGETEDYLFRYSGTTNLCRYTKCYNCIRSCFDLSKYKLHIKRFRFFSRVRNFLSMGKT